jgi:hypothetical protein
LTDPAQTVCGVSAPRGEDEEAEADIEGDDTDGEEGLEEGSDD